MNKQLQLKFKKHFPSLSNNKGIALIMAISSLVLILYLAMEVTYDTNVEYVVNSQHFNRLKSYYAARSGMEISLLRIKIFQTVQSKFGKQLGSQAGVLDEIWKFPFAWPLPAPPSMNAVDKDTYMDKAKKSSMEATFLATIEDEGSKIDLNDLASPSKKLQEVTRQQLINIFEQKWKSDEEFSRNHEHKDFEDLVNNITDWLSNKKMGTKGADKKSIYRDYEGEFPPNRNFRTIEEIKMVAGMNDDYYELLKDRITIYGMKGINPNIARKEVIMSLDPGITEEIASAVISRRESIKEGGPYKDKNDFWGYVQSKGARLSPEAEKIPIIFDTVFNFKIRSTGSFAGTTREIMAIVVDLNKTATQLKKYTDEEKKAQQQAQSPNPAQPSNGGSQAPQQQTGPSSDSVSKGPPRVVYWNER